METLLRVLSSEAEHPMFRYLTPRFDTVRVPIRIFPGNSSILAKIVGGVGSSGYLEVSHEAKQAPAFRAISF